MDTPEKRALGRGLSALIPETRSVAGERIENIKIDNIMPSKYQPRQEFDLEKHKELVASIKEKGIVQPILVRPGPGGYELIAGERRLRAAKELGISEIPAIVRNVSDVDALELSIIENIQREDLNPIEQANAYQRLMKEFNFTQEVISQVIGKDRTTVTNTLRLLSLPKAIQDLISRGSVSMGHAKAILSLKTESRQIRICQKIVKKGLSVKETEALITRIIDKISGKVKLEKSRQAKDNSIVAIEEELQHIMGTKVRIISGKKRGKIEIEYYSADDLDRIINKLRKSG